MLQLLESIEVMLQNGNSIHPDSIIRGAIRISIGMDQYGMPEGLDTPDKHEQYLKDIGLKKQTAVQWLFNQLEFDESVSMDNIEEIFKQAKEMEKEQIKDAYYQIGKDHQDMIFAIEKDAEQYYNETFKSE